MEHSQAHTVRIDFDLSWVTSATVWSHYPPSHFHNYEYLLKYLNYAIADAINQPMNLILRTELHKINEHSNQNNTSTSFAHNQANKLITKYSAGYGMLALKCNNKWMILHSSQMGSCIAAAPSLITKPSTSPVLITCSMQKWRKKAWGISSRDLQHDHQKSSCLFPTAKRYMRPISHSVLAKKTGQAPAQSYTKCMRYTQAKSHDSERLPSDRRG